MENFSLIMRFKVLLFFLVSLVFNVSGSDNLNALPLNEARDYAIQRVIDDCIATNKVQENDMANLLMRQHGEILIISVYPFSVCPKKGVIYSDYPIWRFKSLWKVTRYSEQEGRFFYWDDWHTPITPDLIKKLKEYQLVYDEGKEPSDYDRLNFDVTCEQDIWIYYFCLYNKDKYLIKKTRNHRFLEYDLICE